MADIKLFHLSGCPYCRAARGWMAELCEEHPEFKDCKVELIDEGIDRETAAKYDYFLVPTYYVNGKKVHEGAATKDKVKAVYEYALECDRKDKK
jgi:glutaredoxin